MWKVISYLVEVEGVGRAGEVIFENIRVNGGGGGGGGGEGR